MPIGPWHRDMHAQEVQTALVKACIGWDMAAFDSWLFDSATWRNFPTVRQRLLAQRMQLERDCNDASLQAEHLRERLLAHFVQLKRLVSQCKNCTPEVKSAFVVPSLKTHHSSSKLSAVEIARLQRQWAHLLSTGQKYGALTLLAKQYGVSSATIKKVVHTV